LRIARNTTTIALTAGLICLLVYLRALSCGFVNLDDPYFILNNEAIRHLDGRLLAWAFGPPGFDLWIPLTWLSLAVDYRVWGLNPLGYHLTNILLHAANTALVVLIADRLCRDRCGEAEGSAGRPHLHAAMLLLAGLLFGIHPLRVESVAWVTERKDVLNGLFSLGSVLLYLCYVQRRERGQGGTGAYLFSLLLFALSLMAKSVSVVLPAMLLVADWYPLRRLRKGKTAAVLREKVPFLALSTAITVVTVAFAARNQLLTTLSELSFGQRLLVAGNALFEYVRLELYPVGISPYYVLPAGMPASFAVKTAAVVAIACCVAAAARRRPGLAAAWLCFLLPLLPVLGFMQNGEQALAARYSYLPSVAPAITVAALVVAAYRRIAAAGPRPLTHGVVALVAAVLLFYAGMTMRLIDVWHDTGTLWSRVIDVGPLGRAYADRGVFYLSTGKSGAAVDDFSAALRIAAAAGMPTHNLLAFRGVALEDTGRFEEAIGDLTAAIGVLPHPTYYHHRGLALRGVGRAREAAEDFALAGPNPPPIDWF
jgi:protein O-mannosyl-transferase